MSAQRSLARPPRRGERGAAAVEAALVTLFIVPLIFGLVEFSFVLRDHVAVASVSRAGVRAASTGANAGLCTPEAADQVPCPAGSVPELAQRAAEAIGSTGTVLPQESFDHIMVYKANEHGFPGDLTSMPEVAACTAECVVYRWYPDQQRFRYASGSWDSRQIDACAGYQTDSVTGLRSRRPLDSVGVQVAVDRTLITGLFGRTMRLSDHAVLKFEPLPDAHCARGSHL